MLSLSAPARGLAASDDVDEDGLSDAFEQQLIDQYRPILVYTSWDAFALNPANSTAPRGPASVDWFVRHCRLRYPDGGTVVYSKAELAADPLRVLEANHNGVSSDALQVEGPSEYHLDPDGVDYAGESPYYRPVGTYGHVVPVAIATPYSGRVLSTAGSILVQYWQFFPYNDVLGWTDIANHEGDWLYLDAYVEPVAPYAIRYLVYHHHGDGACPVTVLPLDRPLPADGIPRCYIEEGSHEWWPFASGGGECSFEGFGNNGHDGHGPSYRTANVKNLGERTRPMDDPEARIIIQFNGKWGNDSDWFADTPPGPIYQFYPTPAAAIYPPCKPRLLSPSNEATCRGINGSLTWLDVATASAYRVQLSSDPSFSTGILLDATTSNTSRGYGPLAYNAVYYWRVRNDGLECARDVWSENRSFRTEMPLPSGVPTLLSPPAGATGLPTTGTLDWTDVPGATRYGVSIRCPSDEVIASSSALTSSNYAYALAPGDYEWFAVAYNACGQSSGQTLRRSFRVDQGSACGVPTLLAPLNGASCVEAGDTLKWSGAASSYLLRLKSRRCDDHEIPVTGTHYVLGGLDRNETYYWSVREVCDCAVASSCFSFRSGDRLHHPNLISPSDGANDQPLSVTLEWDPVDRAGGYRVQLGTACEAGPEVDVASSTYISAGLEQGRTYFWRVAALDSCGTASDYSSCRDFKTGLFTGINRFYFPDSLMFVPGQNGVTIPVLAENLDSIRGYEMRVRLDPDVFEIVGMSTSSTRSQGAVQQDATIDTHHGTCRVIVSTGNECPPSIPPGTGVLLNVIVNVAPGAALGSSALVFEGSPRRFVRCAGSNVTPDAFASAAQITYAGEDSSRNPETLTLDLIGPQPSSNGTVMRFGLPMAERARLLVYDVAGRVVATLMDEWLTAGWHTLRWDGHGDRGSSVPSGVYLARLVAGGMARSKRVIVIR